MTAKFSDAQNLVRAFFSTRSEEVLAAEKVIELNRGTGKKPKPRILALSQSSGSIYTSRSIYILTENDEVSGKRQTPANKFKVKEQQPISRLTQVKVEGASVLSLQFSGAGAMSLSFESNIQRDLLNATLKKMMRSNERESGGGLSSPLGTGRGGRSGGDWDDGGEDAEIVVSSSVTTLQANIRARRQKEKRLERRAAWTTEEEDTILTEMDRLEVPASEMTRFDEKVADHIVKTNDALSLTIIELDQQWRHAARSTQELLDDVADTEDAIEHLAEFLMSRRSTIEEIEHACTTMQRKKDNLEALFERLVELRDSIELTPANESVIRELQAIDNVMNFFGNDFKVQNAITTIDHISRVLRGGHKLRKKFPIDAVVDRMQQFAAFGRFIALRARDFMYGVIVHCTDGYYADTSRFSSRNAVRLIPHEELLEKVRELGPMMETLGRVERESYDGAIRFYCTRVQKVYQREIRGFFVELRRHFRRTGWAGEPLLGNEEMLSDQLNQYVQAGEIGASPMRPSVSSMTPTRSNSISSMQAGGGGMFGSRAGSAGLGGGGGSASRVSGQTDELQLLLPNLGTKVLRGNLKIDLALSNKQSAAMTSVASAFASRLGGETGGGSLRPDIVFAIALEAVMDIVLAEEQALRQGFRTDAICKGAGPNGAARLTLAMNELFSSEMLLPVKTTIGAASSEPTTSTSILKEPEVVVEVTRPDMLTTEFTSFLEHMLQRCDRIYALSMLTMVQMLMKEGSATQQSAFALSILQSVRAVIMDAVHKYTANQIQSIRDCAVKYQVGKVALLNCFSNLPIFLNRIEFMHNILQIDSGNKMEEFASHAAEVVSQMLDHCFEALDTASATVATSSTSSVSAAASAKLGVQLPFGATQAQVDQKNMAHNYFMLYRHYSYYCAMLATMSPGGGDSSRPPLAPGGGGGSRASRTLTADSPDPWAPVYQFQARDNPMLDYIVTLLRLREEDCLTKRERYADLYFNKRIFTTYFGDFATFVLRAEELLATYEASELVHQRSLSKEVVMKVLSMLPRMFAEACYKSAVKIRTHCTRDLRAKSCEEGFHRGLLKSSWERYRQLILGKVRVVDRLLDIMPTLQDLRNPVTDEQAKRWLDDAVERSSSS